MPVGGKIEQIYNEIFSIAAQGVEPGDIDAAVQFFALISENFSQAKATMKGRDNDGE